MLLTFFCAVDGEATSNAFSVEVASAGYSPMANNGLILFCLLNGETSSNAFSVEIEPTKSVGQLMDLIRAKNTPDFEISLRASSPSGAPPFALHALDSKAELLPTDEHSDVST
ncbi:hypothetical protein BG004_007344 [Podila humilis]|nr:hypothetical protein BG004_007344 [Podila humilis]